MSSEPLAGHMCWVAGLGADRIAMKAWTDRKVLALADRKFAKVFAQVSHPMAVASAATRLVAAAPASAPTAVAWATTSHTAVTTSATVPMASAVESPSRRLAWIGTLQELDLHRSRRVEPECSIGCPFAGSLGRQS